MIPAIFYAAVCNFITPSLPIRIMIGCWALATFVLANYYTTLIISYTTAPNPQPMIKSIYDLRNRPDIRVITNKESNSETVMLVCF